MSRKVVTILIYSVIGLAILGVTTQLLTNTINFFTSLLIMIGIGAAVFAAIYFLFIKQRTPTEMKKYRQAVKQSKMKYKNTSKGASRFTPKSKSVKTKKLRKRPTHLRVIEGNKSKKKRASN